MAITAEMRKTHGQVHVSPTIVDLGKSPAAATGNEDTM
jgi:hypothetical protein